MANRLYNTFNFIGELGIPKDKNKFHEKINTKNPNWDFYKINFGIKESKTNSAFLELFGGYQKDGKGKVYSFSKGKNGEKGSKLEIPWGDRNKESVMDNVADFKKIIIDLETDFEKKKERNKLFYRIVNIEKRENKTEEDKEKLEKYKKEFKEKSDNRHEFITEYDAIQFLAKNLKKYEQYKFRITGSLDLTEYKGNCYKKYIPETIEIVPNDTKNRLSATVDIFFDEDCIDDEDFMEDKKIFINGYLQNYVRDEGDDRFFPQTFIINGTKLDLENEKHMAILDILKGSFKPDDEGYHHLQYEIRVYRGAEKVEFTYEDLTDEQKKYVDCGISSVEDYAPRGGLLGNNVNEFRIVKPILKKVGNFDFKEGALHSGLEEDEFLEKIIQDTSDIKYDDIKNEDKEEDIKVGKEEKSTDDVFNDLFGDE